VRTCWVCGEDYTVSDVTARILHGGLDAAICPACVAAGEVGAAKRMREQAESLHSRAAYLARAADELIGAETWPSADDIERLALELDAERRAGVMAEADEVPF